MLLVMKGEYNFGNRGGSLIYIRLGILLHERLSKLSLGMAHHLHLQPLTLHITPPSRMNLSIQKVRERQHRTIRKKDEQTCKLKL